MKLKNLLILLIIIGVLAGSIYLILTNNPKKIIGGNTDEHGCLIDAGYSWNKTDYSCVREWEIGEERYQDKIYCQPEQRNSDACIFLHNPVCGYPMKETYPNSCIACSEEEVEYYKMGECF